MDSGANLFNSLKHLQGLLSKTENVLQRDLLQVSVIKMLLWLMAAWFSLDGFRWECFSSHHTDLQPLLNTQVHFSLGKGQYLWVRKKSSGAVSWGHWKCGRVLLKVVGALQVSLQLQNGIWMWKCCRTGVQTGVKGRKAAEQRENELKEPG